MTVDNVLFITECTTEKSYFLRNAVSTRAKRSQLEISKLTPSGM